MNGQQACCLNPLPPSDAVRKQGKSFCRIFSVHFLSRLKKYHPPGNLKFNYLGIFQSLKLRILMEIILPISLKLNFTPNNLGCYGLKVWRLRLSTKLKLGKSVIFEIILWINISMKSSRWYLFVNMIVNSFFLKKLSPCFIFIPETGVELPETGLSSYCALRKRRGPLFLGMGSRAIILPILLHLCSRRLHLCHVSRDRGQFGFCFRIRQSAARLGRVRKRRAAG